MPFFRNQRQYQQLAFVAVVAAAAVPAVVTTTLSSPVQFKSRFIYQSHTEPTFVPPAQIDMDSWYRPLSEPTRRPLGGMTGRDWNLIVPVSQIINPTIGIENTTASSPVVFKSRFIYQTKADPVFVVRAAVSVDSWYRPLETPVRVKRDPSSARALDTSDGATQVPIPDVDTDSWHRPLVDPVRTKRLATALSVNAFIDPAGDRTVPVISTASSPVIFSKEFQYPSLAYTPFVAGEVVTLDKWVYPLSEPVRQKAGLRASLQQAAIGPVLDQETQIINNFESRWHFPWSDPVRLRRFPTAEQPFLAYTPQPDVDVDSWYMPLVDPVRVKRDPGAARALDTSDGAIQTPTVTETITVDKWFRWLETPVLAKPGLRTALQQAAIGPVLDQETQIINNFESRWHFPWSEPVRAKRQLPTSEQQTLAYTPQPDVDVDTWVYPWTDPVRLKRGLPVGEQQFLAYAPFTAEVVDVDSWFRWLETPTPARPGLRAALQQAAIGPVLDTETQIINQYESRWHFAWSEPVRVKRQLPTPEQPFLAYTPQPDIDVDSWLYPLSEPVRFKRFPTAEQQAQVQGPLQTPEFITVDKWIYPWTDPVRQKIGIRASLQQAFIAPVLSDEQLTGTFESRWHQPWSDPVRTRRITTALQVPAFIDDNFTPEVITLDKWSYPWTDPVRQKAGLRPQLQQTVAYAPFTPEFITVDKWTYAWSEPVRFRRFATAEQQSVAQPTFTPESIFVDKWLYPWTDPVRQKIGLRASLQEAFIGPRLRDDQLTGTIESRWHQPWSEPLRSRRFPTSEQQGHTEPTTAVFETVNVDKWVYPWSEPVRQKPGQRASLQQAFIGLTLNPETQIIQGFESRWHQPWSEPLRFRRFPTSEQVFSVIAPRQEIVTVDKWFAAWREPVRFKSRALQLQIDWLPFTPAAAVSTAVTTTSLSSPVFFKGRFIYRAHTEPTFTPPITVDEWVYRWSEPVRQKIGIRVQNQPFQFWSGFTPRVTVDEWVYRLSEPVRLKIGLRGQYHPFIFEPIAPVPPGILLSLSATEVNTDSAFFGIILAAPVASAVVSIKEIPVIRTAVASIEEVKAIKHCVVSIDEIDAETGAVVSIKEG